MGMKFGYENLTDDMLELLKAEALRNRDGNDRNRDVTDEEIATAAAGWRSRLLECELERREVAAVYKSLAEMFAHGHTPDEPGRELAHEGFSAARLRAMAAEFEDMAEEAAQVEAEKAAQRAKKDSKGKKPRKPKLRLVSTEAG